MASAGHSWGPEPEVCSHLVCVLLLCLLPDPRPPRGSLALARPVTAVGGLPSHCRGAGCPCTRGKLAPALETQALQGLSEYCPPPPSPLPKHAPLDEPHAEVTCGPRPSPRVSGGRNLKKTGSVLRHRAWPTQQPSDGRPSDVGKKRPLFFPG